MVAVSPSEELSTPPQQPAPNMRSAEIQKLDACPSEIHDKALALFEHWQTFSAPRNSSVRDDKGGSVPVQFAACLLLVAHSQELKGAEAATSAASSTHIPSLRDIVTGYGTTCFEVFLSARKMLQTGAGQDWLQSLYTDKEAFDKSVKEIISKFLILTITCKKLEKLYAEHCNVGTSGSHVPEEPAASVSERAESPKKEEKMQTLAGALEANLVQTNLDSLAAIAVSTPTKGEQAKAELNRQVLALAWNLFLFVREKAGFFDLLPGFYALLSCLHYALSGADGNFTVSLTARQGSSEENETLLAGLCRCCQCDVNKTVENTHDLVTSLLNSAAKDSHLVGWMEGENKIASKENLSCNLGKLGAVLRKMQPRLVDGLLPLELPASVGHTSTDGSGDGVAIKPAPPAFDPALHAPRTPTRPTSMRERPSPGGSKEVQTPVRKALGDVQFLNDYLKGEDAEPGPALIAYFDACAPTHNPAAVVAQRINCLPEDLVMQEQAKQMGVKLYLKSLRLILEREEERLGRKSFPELLLDDSMHKALLAICFEIVSRAHVQIKLSFPAIPKAFNVCHMEFFVMIFNFLNAFETKLSRSARLHLASLQNKLLEYGVWQSDSPLWAHFEDDDMARMWNQVLDGCGHPNLQQSAMSQSPMIVRAVRSFNGRPPTHPPASPLHATPLSPVRGNIQAHAGEASKPVGPNQKQLICLARKFWARMYDVVFDLHINLQPHGMSTKCFETALAVLKKIFLNSDSRKLLQDRHMHQIVMCVIFGVSKLEDETPLSFRKIIDVHSATGDRFMDMSEALYWTVHIGPGPDQKGNIIEFYNKTFVSQCKELLLDTVSQQGGSARGMATPPMSPQTPSRPSKRVCVSPGVFTSPSRVTHLTITPRTRRLATSEQASINDFSSPGTKRQRSEQPSSCSAKRTLLSGSGGGFVHSTPPRHPGSAAVGDKVVTGALPSRWTATSSQAGSDLNFGASSPTVAFERPPKSPVKPAPPAAGPTTTSS